MLDLSPLTQTAAETLSFHCGGANEAAAATKAAAGECRLLLLFQLLLQTGSIL